MSYTVNRFSAEPFTNEFGQVIIPGDEVVYAGTSWHRTTMRKAIFEGVYWGKSYRSAGETVVAVRCGGIPEKKFVWDNYIPGDRANSTFHHVHHEPYERKAILPLKRVYKLDTTVEKFDGTSF